METFTDQDLINELLELRPNCPPRHGGVTIEEWAAAKGIDKRTAYAHLEEWVRQGLLHAELNQVEGHDKPLKVYYKTGS